MRSASEGGRRVLVCADSELDAAHPARVLLGERPVLVVRDSDGTIHAIDDTCTHADISLSDGFVEAGTVECWAHGARFDLRTGAPVALPANEPLRVYSVEIADGDVYLRADLDLHLDHDLHLDLTKRDLAF